MRYYKSEDNQVYAYESEGFKESWVKSGLIPITEAEAKVIANPPPTPEQLQQQAESEKRYRLSQATIAIAPFQYAVDLQMATEEEKASLLAWKKYCVLLSRVDCTTTLNITWPEQPE
ncbi:tail fiber assembly protein [Xenorhabdus stockiae]|uniref:tail fiber assembly protein n=1 Tax=Xenorhabdus stockiae TaxID=351614 RepID=UPI003CF72E2F